MCERKLHVRHSSSRTPWRLWQRYISLVSLCVLVKMASKSRFVLQTVFSGLRAHTVWNRSSTPTLSQGRRLWRPEVRHVSCSYPLLRGDVPVTGTEVWWGAVWPIEQCTDFTCSHVFTGLTLFYICMNICRIPSLMLVLIILYVAYICILWLSAGLMSANSVRMSGPSSLSFRSHTCGELTSHHVGDKVTLCGWVQYLR